MGNNQGVNKGAGIKKGESYERNYYCNGKTNIKKTGYPEIVILGYDPVSGKQHVTTYGETKVQCIDAAKAGNFIKKACGWPDEFCHAKPNKQSLKDKKEVSS